MPQIRKIILTAILISIPAATLSQEIKIDRVEASDVYESSHYWPRFNRGIDQDFSQIMRSLKQSREKNEEVFVNNYALPKQIRSLTINSQVESQTEEYKIDFAGFYEIKQGVIKGYAIAEPLFIYNKPMEQMIKQLPSSSNFNDLLNIDGRNIVPHYYEKVHENGKVEAYLYLNYSSGELLLLDIYMSQGKYDEIKPLISEVSNKLIDHYYKVFTDIDKRLVP